MLDPSEVQLLNGMFAGRLVVAGYEVAQHLCNTGCRPVGNGMCEKHISQQVLAQVGFYDRVAAGSLGLRQRLLWVKEFRLITPDTPSNSVSSPNYLECVIDPARSFFWHWCGPGVGGGCGVERGRNRAWGSNSAAAAVSHRAERDFVTRTEREREQTQAAADDADEAIRLGRLVLLASEWQLGSSFVEDSEVGGRHLTGTHHQEMVETITPYLDLTLRYGDGVVLLTNLHQQHHHRRGHGRENYYYRVATVQEQALWEFQFTFERATAPAEHAAAEIDYQTQQDLPKNPRASSASSDVTTTAAVVPNTALSVAVVTTSC